MMKKKLLLLLPLIVGMMDFQEVCATANEVHIVLLVPYKQVKKGSHSYALLFDGTKENPPVPTIGPTTEKITKKMEQEALIKSCEKKKLPYTVEKLSYLTEWQNNEKSPLISFWFSPCLPKDTNLLQNFLIIGNKKTDKENNTIVAEKIFGEKNRQIPDFIKNTLKIEGHVKITIYHYILAPDENKRIVMAKIEDPWKTIDVKNDPNNPQIPTDKLKDLGIEQKTLTKLDLPGALLTNTLTNAEKDIEKPGNFVITVFWTLSAIPEKSKSKFSAIEDETIKTKVVPSAKQALGIKKEEEKKPEEKTVDVTPTLETLAKAFGQIAVEAQ